MDEEKVMALIVEGLSLELVTYREALVKFLQEYGEIGDRWRIRLPGPKPRLPERFRVKVQGVWFKLLGPGADDPVMSVGYNLFYLDDLSEVRYPPREPLELNSVVLELMGSIGTPADAMKVMRLLKRGSKWVLDQLEELKQAKKNLVNQQAKVLREIENRKAQLLL